MTPPPIDLYVLNGCSLTRFIPYSDALLAPFFATLPPPLLSREAACVWQKWAVDLPVLPIFNAFRRSSFYSSLSNHFAVASKKCKHWKHPNVVFLHTFLPYQAKWHGQGISKTRRRGPEARQCKVQFYSSVLHHNLTNQNPPNNVVPI